MQSGSPFWRFSLSLYSRPGVPAACLALQDGFGADVNVFLYSLWCGLKGRQLAPQDASSVRAVVEDWRVGVVVPLRTARRNLKTPPAAFGELSESLRTIIKSAELESERLQQEVLFAHRPVGDIGTAQDPALAVPANVQAYADVLHVTFDPAPVSVLLAALSHIKDNHS